MNDNRYSPPSAPVADIENEVSLERPQLVVLAVRLLWASFVLSLPGVVYDLANPQPDVPRGMLIAMSLIGLAITFALSLWLNTAAWKGRSYARWVMAVLMLIGIAVMGAFFKVVFEAWTQMPWYLTILGGLTMFLNAFGNALLFVPSANAWYREMRARR